MLVSVDVYRPAAREQLKVAAAHDAMAPRDAMATAPMAPDEMTKAQRQKHDAMMKHDAMKHDAMKPDAMKSATPQ